MSDEELQTKLDDVLPQRYEMGFRKPSHKLCQADLPSILEAVGFCSAIGLAKMELDHFLEGSVLL